MTDPASPTARRRAALAARKLLDIAPPALSLAMVDLVENRTGEADLKFLPLLVRPGEPSADVGANRGIYARRLARLSATVLAFEPQPDLARRLARAVPDNVIVLPVALSGATGPITMRVPLVAGSRAHTRGTLGEAQGEHVEVMVLRIRLDDLGLDSLGFVKVDVEGHETSLLDGAIETIRRCRPRLLVECDVATGTHPSTVQDRLAPLGYEGWFHFAGKILPVDEFDAGLHQSVAKEFGGPRPEAHATNFMFLPEDEATAVLDGMRSYGESTR
jgi:FkbM family methyltransferase